MDFLIAIEKVRSLGSLLFELFLGLLNLSSYSYIFC